MRSVFGQYRAPTGVASAPSNRTEGLDEIRLFHERMFGSIMEHKLTKTFRTVTGNVIGSQTQGIEIYRAQRVAISGNTI